MWAVGRIDCARILVFRDDQKYGDPYEYVITVTRIPGSEGWCELGGVLRGPTPSEFRAIRQALLSLGYIGYVRRKGRNSVVRKRLCHEVSSNYRCPTCDGM